MSRSCGQRCRKGCGKTPVGRRIRRQTEAQQVPVIVETPDQNVMPAKVLMEGCGIGDMHQREEIGAAGENAGKPRLPCQQLYSLRCGFGFLVTQEPPFKIVPRIGQASTAATLLLKEQAQPGTT